MGIKRHQAGRTENDIMVKVLQIICTEDEFCPFLSQFGGLVPHFLLCAFVAGCYITPCIQQQLNQRFIADTDADYTDSFINCKHFF